MNTEQEREAFKKHYEALFDLTETPDAWGNPRFAHESVEAIWYGWRDRAALQSQDREDALRYRFIRSIVSASNPFGRGSWQFHYDRLPKPLDNPMKGVVAQNFDEAIDHARRVEGEGE